jgi:hypothetical protein
MIFPFVWGGAKDREWMPIRPYQQPQAAFTCNKRKNIMKTQKLLKTILLGLGCATLTMASISVEADAIKGHAGTTFTVAPIPGSPEKFTHTVDGVVRLSSLGNCTVHFDVTGAFDAQGNVTGAGTFKITSADGKNSFQGEGVATGSPDPENPQSFLNFHYDLKITGGTGLMQNVRGKAVIDGFGMFTETTAEGLKGKATWLLTGHVSNQGKDNSEEDDN